MKFVDLTPCGDVNDLELSPSGPRTGLDAIKVRMVGASVVSPIDWKLRRRALETTMPLALSTSLERGAPPKVVDFGPGVTRFKVATRVPGLVTGGCAEFVAASVDVWAAFPARRDLAAATLGAHGAVALEDDAEVACLPRLDAIADAVGGTAFAKLATGGTTGSVVGEPAGAVSCGFIVRRAAHLDSARLASLARAIAEGKELVGVAKGLPLSQAREAQTFADGQPGGQVILTETLGARRTTFAERAAIAATDATFLRSGVDDLASPAIPEMGTLIDQARGGVILGPDIFAYHATLAERFLSPLHRSPGSGEAQRCLSRLETALASLEPRDPFDGATTVGPPFTGGALLELVERLERVGDRANLVMAGNRVDRVRTVHTDELDEHCAPKPGVSRGFLRSRRGVLSIWSWE